jgi:hypothetical protein
LLKIPVGNPESRHKALKPQVRGHLLAGPDSLPAELARLLAVARRRLQLIYLAPNLGFSQVDLILKNGVKSKSARQSHVFLIHQRERFPRLPPGVWGCPDTLEPHIRGLLALGLYLLALVGCLLHLLGVVTVAAMVGRDGDRQNHGRPGMVSPEGHPRKPWCLEPLAGDHRFDGH